MVSDRNKMALEIFKIVKYVKFNGEIHFVLGVGFDEYSNNYYYNIAPVWVTKLTQPTIIKTPTRVPIQATTPILDSKELEMIGVLYG